jgi:hypothetical protein
MVLAAVPDASPALPAVAVPTEPQILIPWAELAPPDPVALRIRHTILFNPEDAGLQVKASDWTLDRLNLLIFDGMAHITGRGVTDATEPSDVSTTLTMTRIDVRRMMQFLNLPRTGEMEARVSGALGVEIRAGDWARLTVDLKAEPGTAYISRPLLNDLLTPGLGPETMAQVDEIITRFFGTDLMIPLEGLTLTGALDRQVLALRIPVRIKTISALLEPRIERDLLWEIWKYLRNAGLKDIESVRKSPGGAP